MKSFKFCISESFLSFLETFFFCRKEASKVNYVWFNHPNNKIHALLMPAIGCAICIMIIINIQILLIDINILLISIIIERK